MANSSQVYFITRSAVSGGGAFDYFTMVDAVIPVGSDALAVGNNNHPLMSCGAVDDSFVDFPGVALHTGPTQVAIFWSASVIVGDTNWIVSWERDAALSVNLGVDSFAPTKTVVSAAPPVVGQLRKATLSFTQAEMGGVAQDDPYRLRIRRLGGVAPDTMGGSANLFRVALEAP